MTAPHDVTPYGVPDGYRPCRGSTEPGVKWCDGCGVHRVEPPRTLCPTCTDEAKDEP